MVDNLCTKTDWYKSTELEVQAWRLQVVGVTDSTSGVRNIISEGIEQISDFTEVKNKEVLKQAEYKWKFKDKKDLNK